MKKMMNQQVERNEFLQLIADIIGYILKLFQPFVTPIGVWMVLWINTLLEFFPANNLTIYIVIFVLLIISGVIINSKWPGEKYIDVYAKEGVDGTVIEHLDEVNDESSKKEENADEKKEAYKLFKKDED